MMPVIVQIFARSPPAILLALGGIGYLLGIAGAGILLFLGFVLQAGWLVLRRGAF